MKIANFDTEVQIKVSMLDELVGKRRGQVNKACQKNKLQFVTPFYNKLLVCKNYLK